MPVNCASGSERYAPFLFARLPHNSTNVMTKPGQSFISPNKQAFQADLPAVVKPVEIIDESAVPLLQHAHPGLEEMPHAQGPSNQNIAHLHAEFADHHFPVVSGPAEDCIPLPHNISFLIYLFYIIYR